MALPRLIMTGASGFLGRHLLEALKEDYQIIGLARRSQLRCRAPFHPNISWHQVDVADAASLATIFQEFRRRGGADIVMHLAAHYDFTGEDHPEYYRTNVEGLRNVLDQSRNLGLHRFIFSSSVAACDFPAPGATLNESSLPDGDHIYARTKAIGERMLREYSDEFPTAIVRFAALFSDWCEYPPLYMFLRTWLSRAWNARVLGGKGQSAIPYLHVLDAVRFLQTLLDREADINDGEILIASPDGAVSHEQLYYNTVQYWFEDVRKPIFIPKPLIRPGIEIRCLLAPFVREEPFERPWMAKYVDKQLTVNASYTRERLHWMPRARLEVLRRMPFLLENLKANRVEWTQRNRDAMKQVHVRPNLKIYSLLEKHRETIGTSATKALREQFDSYDQVDEKEHRWNHRLILRHLMNAVRTRERADFLAYCRDLAERRAEQGFSVDEVVGAMETLNLICIDTLTTDAAAEELLAHLYQHVTMTFRFGIDQIQEVFEEQDEREARRHRRAALHE